MPSSCEKSKVPWQKEQEPQHDEFKWIAEEGRKGKRDYRLQYERFDFHNTEDY